MEEEREKNAKIIYSDSLKMNGFGVTFTMEDPL